jgi:hypothetical protein
VTERPQAAMQNSFSAGELSPSLFGRVDLDKYHSGLQTCRNAFVDYRGGITRRPGTRYVGVVQNSTVQHRLIPFIFSNVQAYVLVFGDHTMRVVKNGGYVTEPAITVTHTGTTVNAVAHGLSNGDWVSVSDFVEALSVTVIDADHFTLKDTFSGATVTSASTTVARIFTLATPYPAGFLSKMKFTQSFDTMTITHPNVDPYNLTRTQHWVWTLTIVNPGAAPVAPTITSVTATLSGAPPAGATADTGVGFQVTAVDANGEESLPSAMVTIYTLNMETLPVTMSIVWGSVAAAHHYNIYATTLTHGIGVDTGAPTGYVGFTTTTIFNDSDIIPDFTKSPPKHQNPFVSSNVPSCVSYFDDRRVYAGSLQEPQTLWFTRPGQYNNFDTSEPANDGDALTLTIASGKAANIRALLPMPDGLLAFTQNGVYKLSGGGTNTGIKVSSAIVRAQNYIGANDVPPIPINFEILFVQEKGGTVRALTYNFYTSTYEPADLTLLSNHLFIGYDLTEWAYAEVPYKIIWAVRTDGKLLSLTYLKDQKIQGWARHDTNGFVESVVSIPENGTDSVYVIVRRFINGNWWRLIEQMQSKDISAGTEFAWYLDAALDYGAIYPAANLDFSAASGTATATASASVFGSGDVGKVIRAAKGQATVTAFTDATHVTVSWTRAPTDLLATDPQIGAAPIVNTQLSGTWTMAAKVTTLSGLDHLRNAQVSYLADGVPGTGTVSSTGTITIPTAASKVIVGLGFRTQCQTLDLEPSGNSLQGKRKRINSLIAKVQDTGVLNWGPNFNELTPWTDVYGDKLVNSVMTGDQPLGVNQFYDYGGRVCWQQDLPLPMTVLSLVPELSVGD